MIRSMTGFGRFEDITPEHKITAEIKAVNHRYLDLTIKMPKRFNCFEARIRSLLKKSVQRGKVDIFITYEDLSESQVSLKYNEALAGEYLSYFQKMADTFSLENDIRVSALSRYPEILTMEEQAPDEEKLWLGLKNALDGAVAQFVETRGLEGENLKKDLTGKLDGMLMMVDSIEKRAPQIIAEYRKKLEKKHIDMIVANDLRVDGAGFGTDTNVVTLITREKETALEKMGKEEVAHKILDQIFGEKGQKKVRGHKEGQTP